MVRVTKTIAERRLEDVAEEKRFWCQDGRVLRNLQELESALREMSDETFSHHVSEARNDFSSWVKDVIGDDKLAGDLKRSKTRTQAARYVANRITWLKSKLLPG